MPLVGVQPTCAQTHLHARDQSKLTTSGACQFFIFHAGFKARRELIVSTILQRLERDSLILTSCLDLVNLLAMHIRRGDLQPLDFKTSFVQFVCVLKVILSGRPLTDWTVHVKLCQAASLLFLQSPDGLGALSLVVGSLIDQETLKSLPQSPPGLEIFLMCLKMACGLSPFPAVSLPTATQSQSEVDAWCAVASFLLDQILGRLLAPPAWTECAVELLGECLASAAALRYQLATWQRREADLGGIVLVYLTLLKVAPALPQLVESSSLPPHRELLPLR